MAKSSPQVKPIILNHVTESVWTREQAIATIAQALRFAYCGSTVFDDSDEFDFMEFFEDDDPKVPTVDDQFDWWARRQDHVRIALNKLPLWRLKQGLALMFPHAMAREDFRIMMVYLRALDEDDMNLSKPVEKQVKTWAEDAFKAVVARDFKVAMKQFESDLESALTRKTIQKQQKAYGLVQQLENMGFKVEWPDHLKPDHLKAKPAATPTRKAGDAPRTLAWKKKSTRIPFGPRPPVDAGPKVKREGVKRLPMTTADQEEDEFNQPGGPVGD